VVEDGEEFVFGHSRREGGAHAANPGFGDRDRAQDAPYLVLLFDGACMLHRLLGIAERHPPALERSHQRGLDAIDAESPELPRGGREQFSDLIGEPVGQLGHPGPVAQGTADALVRPAVTAAYIDSLCHHGSKVQFEMVQGVGHAFIARDAAQDAVAWIASRFAGGSSPDDCGRT
jgi:hypothetical protein